MPTIRLGRKLSPSSRLRTKWATSNPSDACSEQPASLLEAERRPFSQVRTGANAGHGLAQADNPQLPVSGTQPAYAGCCTARVRPWHFSPCLAATWHGREQCYV